MASTMASVGLRERNKLRRREQITEAALRLFAERGFDGVTIDEIAAAADVSRRTFFRYFARKEDVILAWKQQMADELRAALAERPEREPPLDAVHRALATVAAGYADRPELTLGLMRLFESGPTLHAGADYEDWDAVLTAGIAERIGVDASRDPAPRLIATVGFAVLTATIETWAANGGSDDLVALLDGGFAELRRVTAAAGT
ncbi:MAG TPA: TetR family transcriptional regulator [Solirubrobacteraceae bacterium]|jgi:AcrR family transcriptional regulator|nr:TetR family transcriptional regulator [Solirubrobacteraceae bacterium]